MALYSKDDLYDTNGCLTQLGKNVYDKHYYRIKEIKGLFGEESYVYKTINEVILHMKKCETCRMIYRHPDVLVIMQIHQEIINEVEQGMHKKCLKANQIYKLLYEGITIKNKKKLHSLRIHCYAVDCKKCATRVENFENIENNPEKIDCVNNEDFMLYKKIKEKKKLSNSRKIWKKFFQIKKHIEEDCRKCFDYYQENYE